jgi:hypothetical protein
MEIGLRTNIVPRLNLQVAAFQQDFSSELSYNADAGANEATAPSRRRGGNLGAISSVRLAGAEHRPCLFQAPLSLCGQWHGGQRVRGIDGGTAIADAPKFIYSAGVLVNGLGPWSGSLQWRRLGTHALTDGATDPQDGGYSEWNMDVAYEVAHGPLKGWKAQIGIFNLFNSHDKAADYYYTARLPGEPAEGLRGSSRTCSNRARRA